VFTAQDRTHCHLAAEQEVSTTASSYDYNGDRYCDNYRLYDYYYSSLILLHAAAAAAAAYSTDV